MDFLDYREKLGIGFCDNEKYKFFLVKIFNILGEIALDTRFCGINANEYREFCRITGTEVDYKLLSEFIGPAGYAKHHDKTELNVLEYLMYQTGNIIRLLITLKQAEPTPDN